VKIAEMFGDVFSQRKVVWKKRGDHIERCEVDNLNSARHAGMNAKLEVDNKKEPSKE